MDYKEKIKSALNDRTTDYEVVRWIEQTFPELKESEDKKPNGAIVMEDFNDGDGFYKVNLAYLNKEQVEDIEKIVKRWNAIKYDEEAIRACIGIILTDASEQRFLDFNTSLKDCLAWIEEQANHANFRNKIQVGDKVTRNEDGVLVNLSQLKRVAKKDERQGEQKPAGKIEPKFEIGDVIKRGKSTLEVGGINTERQFYELRTREHIVVNTVPFSEQGLWKLLRREPSKTLKGTTEDEDVRNFLIGYFKLIDADSEWGLEKETKDRILFWLQNPQRMVSAEAKEAMYDKPAWSEEDEEMLKIVIKSCEQCGNYTYYWLKSIKGRVHPQPRQEWGEEDEKLYNDLSDTYFYNDEDYPEETYKLMLKRVLDWMNKRAKSLRPQNRWKPSEKQLNELRKVITNTGFNPYVIESIYDDLKKLKS